MEERAPRKEKQMPKQSRRQLLTGAGLVGIATASAAPAEAAQSAAMAAAHQPEALETLTALEAETLEAVADRILPSDENGPGAKEARAINYIDRSLASHHADNRAEYGVGLSLLNEAALSAEGKPFHLLTADQQDAMLAKLEADELSEFPGGASFFRMVRDHVIEGMFSDPYYGGNRDFVGWDLLRYPGIRLGATEREIEQGSALEPTHKSAYDHAAFTKAGHGVR